MPSNIPALPAGFSDDRIVPPSMVEVIEKLAHPARFELTTSAFGGQRSIQLSYGCPYTIWRTRDGFDTA
jgi:hypothetical protein